MISANKLPPLKIGDLVIDPPIIQGGMGVLVSASRLASSVSNEGSLGVIASVGTGEDWHEKDINYPKRSYRSLRALIRKAKTLTSNPIGVNIMCALTNYKTLVQASVEEDVDVIISGAGLPLKLPGMVEKKQIKLIPIVSSGRAAELICKTWLRRFKRLPDAFVVEGPLAGGHIGFDMEELQKEVPETLLETPLGATLEVADRFAQEAGVEKIPVIAAGGIYDGRDIARFLHLGASGVQMATRFVCTDECDVAQEYKETYLNCHKEDIIVIKSPLGLPLRVIRNDFIDRVLRGEEVGFKCQFHCLLTCDPKTTNYCIGDALLNASRGIMDQGFATCGANAYRVDKIVPVRELIDELVTEAAEEYAKLNPPT